jgi:hypothetical protein
MTIPVPALGLFHPVLALGKFVPVFALCQNGNPMLVGALFKNWVPNTNAISNLNDHAMVVP